MSRARHGSIGPVLSALDVSASLSRGALGGSSGPFGSDMVLFLCHPGAALEPGRRADAGRLADLSYPGRLRAKERFRVIRLGVSRQEGRERRHFLTAQPQLEHAGPVGP